MSTGKLRRVRAAFSVCVPLSFWSMSALASDINPLGIYIGGAIGQARDTYTAAGATDGTRAGWKAVAGLRPIPFFGAEVEYVDFGKSGFSAPVGSGPYGGGVDGAARAAAVGLFGVGYLPLYSPFLSAYAKVGMERLHTTVNGFAPCAPPADCIALLDVNENQTHLAYGGGLQAQFNSLALRAEYERSGAGIGHPNLLSLGMSWTF